MLFRFMTVFVSIRSVKKNFKNKLFPNFKFEKFIFSSFSSKNAIPNFQDGNVWWARDSVGRTRPTPGYRPLSQPNPAKVNPAFFADSFASPSQKGQWEPDVPNRSNSPRSTMVIGGAGQLDTAKPGPTLPRMWGARSDEGGPHGHGGRSPSMTPHHRPSSICRY